MIIGPSFIHHYSPETRTITKGTIVFRQAGDPYTDCKEKVDIIYDKVRRLLTTVETWLEYSLDDDIKEQTVKALYESISKTLVVATKDIEELIIKHQITKRIDVYEIKDVAVQLQEIADEIFRPYIE